ncbi:MAG: hypothetical protein E6J73_10565 [Deltaproteobacteria bacterium]|nr:MAG: hypothetical protein E6J73_10565 [Deltaproteobacteria bacterium]
MILEMRTYLLKPGMTHNFVERFAEGLTARLQFSKLRRSRAHRQRGAKNRQVAAEDAGVYRHPRKQVHTTGAFFAAAARA